jgi:hypothetical protein
MERNSDSPRLTDHEAQRTYASPDALQRIEAPRRCGRRVLAVGLLVGFWTLVAEAVLIILGLLARYSLL